jgi:hypothetical protein
MSWLDVHLAAAPDRQQCHCSSDDSVGKNLCILIIGGSFAGSTRVLAKALRLAATLPRDSGVTLLRRLAFNCTSPAHCGTGDAGAHFIPGDLLQSGSFVGPSQLCQQLLFQRTRI